MLPSDDAGWEVAAPADDEGGMDDKGACEVVGATDDAGGVVDSAEGEGVGEVVGIAEVVADAAVEVGVVGAAREEAEALAVAAMMKVRR